jgi:hypothetical protein
MANTLRIKRRLTGSTGAPSTLAAAELAFNEVSGGRILYYGIGDVGGTASSVIGIGGPDFVASSIANLSGVISSVGLVTSIVSQTGSGTKFVVDNSPTLVTPNIGVATGTSLVLSGDLTVNGTTTTLSSTTLAIGDKNIVLASAATLDSQADGGGITLRGATDHTWNWVDATDAWTSSDHVDLASGKSFLINGTSVLNGTTLGANVVASSLTSVGTLTSGSLGAGFTAVVVARGGTGVATLTGIVKGNGTSAFTAAVVDTDYLSPSSIIDGGTF